MFILTKKISFKAFKHSNRFDLITGLCFTALSYQYALFLLLIKMFPHFPKYFRETTPEIPFSKDFFHQKIAFHRAYDCVEPCNHLYNDLR
ncbi:unnamed protein product [Blepharisma stoltei]|uniref:Uncharacterized protein n=1 Tax=Blepharisma stoltei TaxID=1481888 RepID=A0AAU9JNK1_9CILI|nr:unnamed protein product [Blepharisma stoltei]